MKQTLLVLIVMSFLTLSLPAQDKKIWAEAGQQVAMLYKETVTGRNGRKAFPRSVENDSLKLVTSGDWTSGFWPGILWLLFEQTGDKEWRAKAEEFTALMEHESRNRTSHDVGFKVYNSYGNGYRLINNEEYKAKILEGAATLASRFNKKTGCIRSWDFEKWKYPVIIDNMMNLELLFAATRLSNDSTYYKIAVAHANTTMKNHFRNDFSSWHVVDYDTATGNVISKTTHQGFADESVWARGQAWALYGYTMCYRETKDPAYLRQAEGVADFILNNSLLPADKIPYWDYSVPDFTKEPRDVSAATITASALYELKNYSRQSRRYKQAADTIIQNLVRSYRSAKGGDHGFILLHSTGNKPAKGEIDVPIIYADYYFLEALLRKGKK